MRDPRGVRETCPARGEVGAGEQTRSEEKPVRRDLLP